jgi:hypothetical protein
MRKLFLTFAFLNALFQLRAQNSEQINLLKAPASPVAQLLNFAPSAIERPTDLSSLWLSVKNSSSDLTKLPNCYAVDLSLAEITKSSDLALTSLKSKNEGDVLWQSLVISTAIKQFQDSTTKKSYYQTGSGVKISIIRAPWSDNTNSEFKDLKAAEDDIVRLVTEVTAELKIDSGVTALKVLRQQAWDKYGEQSPEYAKANATFQTYIQKRYSELKADKEASLAQTLKDKASKFTLERKGWSLDLAGGFTASFPTNMLSYSIANKAGVWLTGGYSGGNNAFSILGIARYLYQPDSIYADSTGKIPTSKINTFDAGTSVNYTSKNGKFNFSVEAIYRSVLNKNVVPSSWRVVTNISYNVGTNQQLAVNFGRDFDGASETGGNLIAGINYVLGLGGGKAIK